MVQNYTSQTGMLHLHIYMEFTLTFDSNYLQKMDMTITY